MAGGCGGRPRGAARVKPWSLRGGAGCGAHLGGVVVVQRLAQGRRQRRLQCCKRDKAAVAIVVAMNDTWSRPHPTSLIYPTLTIIKTILPGQVVRPNIVTRVGKCHSACHRPSDAGGQSLSEDHTQQYIAFLYHSVSNCGQSTILLQSHEGASARSTLIGSNNHQSAQPRPRSLPRQSCQGHGVQ